MDYFVSKLRLIYFSTFSGNRFNPDHIKIVTLELVAAGRFKNQLSQEVPFGTLKEMPHSSPCFNQRPHTSASLFHSHLCPRDSAPSVKPKQTARPRRPLLQCSVCSAPLLARGWQRHGKQGCAGARGGSQLAALPPGQMLPPLAAPAPAGSLLLALLILPSLYKSSRWLDVTPGKGRRHGIGDWYQLLQRKICHTRRV